MSKRVLGKGIDALLGDDEKADGPGVSEVPVSALKPNPHQPRTEFDPATLNELAESIRAKGVLQPVLVEADRDGTYLIVAGERRVRAAKLAGLQRIPVIVRQFSDQEKLEIALVENVQRADLTPIEEAQAYRKLMEIGTLSQEQIAQRVGKDRSTVANALRLLKLPPEVQEALNRKEITAGHARALLTLVNPSDLRTVLRRIVDHGISVRESENLAAALNRGKKGKAGKSPSPPSEARGGGPELREIEQGLIEKLGTKVVMHGSLEKGSIEIEYYSSADLERLMELLK